MIHVFKRPDDGKIVATLGTGNRKSGTCRLDDMLHIHTLPRSEAAQVLWEQKKLGMIIYTLK